MQKIKYEKTYVETYNFNMYKTKTLAIKANMGMGKTKNLVDLCKKYKKVIIVTFRVSLGREFINKFENFSFYQDLNGIIDLDLVDKVIVQVDSLWRIQGACDLLVLDECQYNLIQLVQSKYREKSFNSLLSYIKNSEYLISIDALFSLDIIEYIKEIRNDLVFIENTYKLHKDKKVINYKNNIGIFQNTILDYLKNNKKIIICTNSRKFLRAIEKFIKKIFKNKKSYYYDGVKDYILYLNDWNDADIVGYTPTITAGISFEDKHFDSVFGYFINTSSPAEMSIQQLFRVRNLNDKEYHICVDIKSDSDYPIILEDIENCIIKRHTKLAVHSEGIYIDNYHKNIVKDDYFNLYINILKIINLSKNNYENVLINLLKSQGLKVFTKEITPEDTELNKSIRKQINEIKKENEKEEDNDVVNSRVITEEELSKYNKSYALDYFQKCEVKHYTFLQKYKYEHKLTNEIYSKYKNNYKQFFNLSLINSMGSELNTMLKERVTYKAERHSGNNIKILHNSFLDEKIYYGLKFVENLGFKNIFDKKENEINLDNLFSYIEKYWDDIYLIWNLKKNKDRFIVNNVRNDNEIMKFINSRLNDLFKIRIVKNRKTNKFFIKGLEYWDEIDFRKENIKQNILNNHLTEKEGYDISLLIKEIMT
jgi:hypothetical protein